MSGTAGVAVVLASGDLALSLFLHRLYQKNVPAPFFSHCSHKDSGCVRVAEECRRNRSYLDLKRCDRRGVHFEACDTSDVFAYLSPIGLRLEWFDHASHRADLANYPASAYILWIKLLQKGSVSHRGSSRSKVAAKLCERPMRDIVVRFLLAFLRVTCT